MTLFAIILILIPTLLIFFGKALFARVIDPSEWKGFKNVMLPVAIVPVSMGFSQLIFNGVMTFNLRGLIAMCIAALYMFALLSMRNWFLKYRKQIADS